MHQQAYDWVASHATAQPVKVLDIGGRNINGSVRDLFPAATQYRAVDQFEGEGVDIVADCAEWAPDDEYDVVVSTEVFEHAQRWREIVDTAYLALKPGGRFVATMAGPGRPEHSAIDGGWELHPGEYYRNVDPQDLRVALIESGFVDITVDQQQSPADVRCVATRPV